MDSSACTTASCAIIFSGADAYYTNRVCAAATRTSYVTVRSRYIYLEAMLTLKVIDT